MTADRLSRPADALASAEAPAHDTPMPPANLFENAGPPPTGERFETLLARGPLLIERIVSSARTAPREFRQTQDEWVLLASGTATLEVDGTPHLLRAGDHLFLPAGTPHTVLEVSEGAVWLAVHLHPPIAGADGSTGSVAG